MRRPPLHHERPCGERGIPIGGQRRSDWVNVGFWQNSARGYILTGLGGLPQRHRYLGFKFLAWRSSRFPYLSGAAISLSGLYGQIDHRNNHGEELGRNNQNK